MTDALLHGLVLDPLSSADREHHACGGTAVTLPPIIQDGSKHLRDLEQLRARGLLARRPSVTKAPVRRVERLPAQLVQVTRAESAKHSRDAGHRLALKDGHPMVLVRVLPRQVASELFVREHGALASVHLHCGHAHASDRVLRQRFVAPELVEDKVHDATHVNYRPPAPPARLHGLKNVADI
ncbi:MAG: hypothetical protein ACOY0T_29985 [Myxococcota bacterium]